MKTVHLIFGAAVIIFLVVVALAGTLTHPLGAVGFVIAALALLGLSTLIRSAKTESLHEKPLTAVDSGNVIKPEVIAVLKGTPASAEDQNKFDSNAILQAAIEIHDALTAWMPLLRFGLSRAGTSEGDANFQMGALYTTIEQASRSYFPPIVSIAIASTLRSYVQYLTTEEGNLNCITAELAVKIICSLSTLEDGLFALVREAGWNNEQIQAQSGELSAKIGSFAGTAKAGIVPLTLAFTMDTYAKALVSGPMGQSQGK
jgi:hypothetical protein